MILAPRIDVSRMRQLVLQNLWHYQQKHHEDDRTKRWTVMFDEQHPLFPQFAQAVVSLQREGLVSIATNGMCHLTDKGYDHCQSNNLKLLPEDRFFEDY